jgi:hypothetical protein
VARGKILWAHGYDKTAERALSMLAPGAPLIQYSGVAGQNGGKDPTAKHPGSAWKHPKKGTVITADCMALAAWSAGFDRWQRGRLHVKGYDGWCETTTVCLDAHGEESLFELLPRPHVGCFVVYPDRKVLGIKREGHIGVVVSVPAEFDGRASWGDVGVVHCHGPSMRGQAISLTTAAAWAKRDDAIFCRFAPPTDVDKT